MTDSDPIIAEIERTITIQGPRGGELEAETGVLEVCLSDAPLVEDLLTEAKHAHADLVRANKPSLSLRAAIRAIEPGWAP